MQHRFLAFLLLTTLQANAQFTVSASSTTGFDGASTLKASTSSGYDATNPGATENKVRSNVPMNEISPRAFRHFRRNFRAVADENWYKSEQGYLVSFMVGPFRQQAWYHPDGSFMCSVKYYSGKELDEQTDRQVHRQFPGYQVKVVTEITDDCHKNFYLVTIEDPATVKTLFICDGTIEVREDLVNAG
ncbi:MAG: hypothetical protein Q8937_01380 [Bacteroidota bacterium]|nr:hypothetical protein [Bacteroidota bacterium]